eukprot:6204259-Pleurochrysis_carterae.AAC.2
MSWMSANDRELELARVCRSRGRSRNVGVWRQAGGYGQEEAGEATRGGDEASMCRHICDATPEHNIPFACIIPCVE